MPLKPSSVDRFEGHNMATGVIDWEQAAPGVLSRMPVFSIAACSDARGVPAAACHPHRGPGRTSPDDFASRRRLSLPAGWHSTGLTRIIRTRWPGSANALSPARVARPKPCLTSRNQGITFGWDTASQLGVYPRRAWCSLIDSARLTVLPTSWRVARCLFFEPGGRPGPGLDGFGAAAGRAGGCRTAPAR